MVAPARAQGARPARVAVGLVRQVVAFQERVLGFAVEAVVDGAQLVLVRAREPVAQADVAAGGDPHQPQPRPARIGLAGALVNLLQGLAHVREPVVLSGQRGLEELVGQRRELLDHLVEPLATERVFAARRGRHRGEPHLLEADLLGQVPVDARDVADLRGQGHPRPDGPARVAPQQLAHPGQQLVVAAAAVVEHAEAVLHLARTVDRHGHGDVVLGQEPDHLAGQQRRVRGEVELDPLAPRRGLRAGVGHDAAQHRVVHQGLAAEEAHVHHPVIARLVHQQIDALAGGLLAHELGLRPVGGVDDLVLAVLVAVRATEVALVGDVQDRGRQRERRQGDDRRRRGRGRRRGGDGADRVHLLELVEGLPEVGVGEPRAHVGEQIPARHPPAVEAVDEGRRRLVEREHRRARHEVEEPAPGRGERMELALRQHAHGCSTAVGDRCQVRARAAGPDARRLISAPRRSDSDADDERGRRVLMHASSWLLHVGGVPTPTKRAAGTLMAAPRRWGPTAGRGAR